jgi:hypothetical protein
MSLLNYDSIPGYAEAINRETVNRELAFMARPLPICGIPIRHLSPRHHILLVGCENRFMIGGFVRREDVAMFLWFLSPEYQLDRAARDRWLKRTLRGLDYQRATDEIREYIEAVIQDWPASTGAGNGKSYMAPVATLVDILASQYGWPDEVILEMPLRRIFQYTRAIECRLNPKAILFNRSDRHVSEWLRRRTETASATTN